MLGVFFWIYEIEVYTKLLFSNRIWCLLTQKYPGQASRPGLALMAVATYDGTSKKSEETNPPQDLSFTQRFPYWKTMVSSFLIVLSLHRLFRPQTKLSRSLLLGLIAGKKFSKIIK